MKDKLINKIENMMNEFIHKEFCKKHGIEIVDKHTLKIEEDEDTATLTFRGPIHDESVADLLQNIEKSKEKSELKLIMNSGGGLVSSSIDVYSRLRDLSNSGTKVITEVSGQVASGAALIFLAGDERIMEKPSRAMVHRAHAGSIIYGNATQFRDAIDKVARNLESFDETNADTLTERTMLNRAEAEEMINKETWILEEEAAKIGFTTDAESEAENSATKEEMDAFVAEVKAMLDQKNK